ncbi:hypothetical protein ACFX15_029216 [Malus domestica]
MVIFNMWFDDAICHFTPTSVLQRERRGRALRRVWAPIPKTIFGFGCPLLVKLGRSSPVTTTALQEPVTHTSPPLAFLLLLLVLLLSWFGSHGHTHSYASTRPSFHLCSRQQDCPRMTVVKRYVLRLFISLKYITANVVDRNNGRIVVSASTVEHSIKGSLECGRSCNAKAAAVVGEVLARRLKVEGLGEGQGRGIHVNVNNEVEKKGFKNRTKIWAIVNALKDNGVKLILDGSDENTSQPNTGIPRHTNQVEVLSQIDVSGENPVLAERVSSDRNHESPPLPVQLQFRESLSSFSTAARGGNVRDKSSWVALPSGRTSCCRVSSPLEAEARAAVMAVSLAIENQSFDIICESDSQVLII